MATLDSPTADPGSPVSGDDWALVLYPWGAAASSTVGMTDRRDVVLLLDNDTVRVMIDDGDTFVGFRGKNATIVIGSVSNFAFDHYFRGLEKDCHRMVGRAAVLCRSTFASS